MSTENIYTIIEKSDITPLLKLIGGKVLNNIRISADEGISLFECSNIGFLGTLANYIREKKNKNYTYFIKNIHIEPSNICINKCKFCEFGKTKETGFELNEEEILEKAEFIKRENIYEIHIVGSAHPDRDLYYYAGVLKKIKIKHPSVHIKAFSAVELDYMIKKANLTIKQGLTILKENGLDSIPGGGAEIFNEEIRNKICPEKINSEIWLEIHETAHRLGIPSNATMLYGHIESYKNRIGHLQKLRQLQDKTGMFNAFIPLKFRNKKNEMSFIKEQTIIDDLKNYAVSRIFLDNFEHIKAYWPMIGRKTAQLSLAFGADDIDGTINNSTEIFTGVASDESYPCMNVDEMVALIKQTGRQPIERDSLYNHLKVY